MRFITMKHIEEAVQYLVSGKGGDHLPYTDASGKPNHRLMGAAWAALHGGYRGNKYDGPNKTAAVAKLKAVYKSEKMDVPQESFAIDGAFFEESLPQNDSFDAICQKLSKAINDNIMAGIDMDGDDDGPEDAAEYAYACVRDVFPDQVVYSMNGVLFQADYKISANGGVVLGRPTEVELSYEPVQKDNSEESDRARAIHGNVESLKESAYDSAKGELTITVIKPGFNKSGARYYPASTLKRDSHIFEGAKMFVDHQTESESKAKPEGSVHNWVANVGKVWAESDGTVKAKAVVIDPQFKAKLDRLKETDQLGSMGVSIRAAGTATSREIEGRQTKYVESLNASRSVDFVTYAGAGGQVEAMESDKQDNELDVDLVSEAVIRQRRPDLVQLIESSAKGEQMKTLEQQLAEAQQKIAALTQDNATLTGKIQESETKAAKAGVAVELSKLLSESKLPQVAKDRISKQFAEAVKVDGIKEAIEAEESYIKSLGGSTTKKNNGSADNGEVRESGDGKKVNVEEAFALMPGMTEKERKLAATRR